MMLAGGHMESEVKHCVLLVERHAADARLISRTLTSGASEELRIECASNGSNALERIRKGGVQGVIVDIEMPGGRGVAAFEKLLSAAPRIPILILSGTENENVAKQAVGRGAQDYIPKSHPQEFRLRHAVRGMIERKAEEESAFLQQQCAEATLSCTGEAVLISNSSGTFPRWNSWPRIFCRGFERHSFPPAQIRAIWNWN
jgi:CheY-like chemotaxis protein